MKKRTKILACIASVLIATFALTGAGCEQTSSANDESFMATSRYVSFRIIETGRDSIGNGYMILVDDDTGVLYYGLGRGGSYYSGITQLTHSDGSPKLLQEYDATYVPRGD